VVVQTEEQVVLEKILARHTKIKRIPVKELLAKLVKSLLRKASLGRVRKRTVQENVVPDLSGHLLSLDAKGIGLRTVKRVALKKMSNSVVSHVDG